MCFLQWEIVPWGNLACSVNHPIALRPHDGTHSSGADALAGRGLTRDTGALPLCGELGGDHAEARPGPVKTHLNRSLGHPEARGHLALGEVLDVAQPDHVAV